MTENNICTVKRSKNKTCVWITSNNLTWRTSCEASLDIINLTFESEILNFCVKCGRKIEVKE